MTVEKELASRFLEVENLPVEGTYEEDFVDRNKWIKKLKVFKLLDQELRKTDKEDRSLFSRVMWLIVYANFSGFLQDSINFQRKEEILRNALGVPKGIIGLRTYKDASGEYRKYTLPRPLRVLQAVEKQIDNATLVMEEQRVKTVDDVKKVNEFMKNFGELKGRWREAKDDWDEASRTIGAKEKNGNLLSAVDSGDLFID